MTEILTRRALIDQAREWIGVKWQQQGHTRFGCDCIGFPASVVAELGHAVDVPFRHGQWPDGHGLNRELSKRLDRVPVDAALSEIKDGDVACLRGGLPTHLAFFATAKGRRTIIHADRSMGRVVETPFTDGMRRHLLVSVWRIPAIVDG